MSRFLKTVLCVVVLASFIGCGGSDDNNGGSGGNNSRNSTKQITSLPSQIATVNFENVTGNTELKLSNSFADINSILDLFWANRTWNFPKWGTGSYGAKYVVKRLADKDTTYKFLTDLVWYGDFNRNSLNQVFNYAGTNLNDLLNDLGSDAEIRHRSGIDADYDGSVSIGQLLNPFRYDLYVDRATVKIDDNDDGGYILTLTTYVTGWFSELDDAALDEIYNPLNANLTTAPIIATTVERTYSPLVLTNDWFLGSHLGDYRDGLIKNEGFSGRGQREVFKKADNTTYTFKYDSGGDLVTWSVEKEIN